MSFIEQLTDVLPKHAHTERSFFEWNAAWSTPKGIWVIKLGTPIIGNAVLKITGPGIHIGYEHSDPAIIIAALRLHGALPDEIDDPLAHEQHAWHYANELLEKAQEFDDGEHGMAVKAVLMEIAEDWYLGAWDRYLGADQAPADDASLKVLDEMADAIDAAIKPTEQVFRCGHCPAVEEAGLVYHADGCPDKPTVAEPAPPINPPRTEGDVRDQQARSIDRTSGIVDDPLLDQVREGQS